MSNQTSEAVPGGPVSTTKTVERQGNGLVVEYGVESTGDERIDVRLADRMPTRNVGEYGFHEAYHPEEWTAEGGELELRTSLEPGAERTFVFGIVAEGDLEVPYEPSEPTVHVDGGESTDETADGAFFDDTDPLLDEGAAEEAESPADDHSTADSDDGGDEVTVDTALDLGDSNGSDDDTGGVDDSGRTDSAADGTRPVDADGGVVETGDRGDDRSVVSALLEELDSGSVTDSETAALREHLDVDRPNSEEVRLDYVQKRMSDFDAYVDAMEELLSVHGNGKDAIQRLDDRLDELAGAVESLEDRQATMLERLDELAETVETNETDIEAVRSSHDEDIEAVQSSHDEDIEDVRAELRRREEAIREDFDDVRRDIESELEGIEAELDDFESIRRSLVEGLERPDGSADADRSVSVTVESGGDSDVESGTSAGTDPDTGTDPETVAGAVDSNGVEPPTADSESVTERDVEPESGVAIDGNDYVGDEGGDDIGDEGSEDVTDDEGSEDVTDDESSDDATGDEDGTGDAADDGDDGARTIFDIGDVDSRSKASDDTPTIDFEDT